MKKIVYFHGLESSQGGDKVSFLSQKGLVWAPEMDYTNPNLFEETLKKVKEIKPDYIIGSSMGGYFAYLMKSHIDKAKCILFNPALHNLDSNTERIGDWCIEGTCFLGENDKEIIPTETQQRLIQNEFVKIEILKNGTHRTPYVVFRNRVSEII